MQLIQQKPKTLIEFNGDVLTIAQQLINAENKISSSAIQIAKDDISLFLELIKKELSVSK